MQAWIGITLAAAAALSSRVDTDLPEAQAAIAARVAANGLPGCRSYYVDGSQGPCLPHFARTDGHTVNGWSQGGNISFSQGALRRLNADEFALLAGHEIAHWYLGHRRSTRDGEMLADRLGADLACRAGFDLANGVGLFRKLRPDSAHPDAETRISAVLAVPCKH